MATSLQRAMRRLNKTYYLHITVPFHLVADFLSESDFRRYDGQWDNIGIELHFDYRPESRDVGICEGMNYRGFWSVPLVGNYPSAIKDAIDKYLQSIDVEGEYGEEALIRAL